jgi:hypothetical protein
MYQKIERLQHRGFYGRQRLTIQVLLLLEPRGQKFANIWIVNRQRQRLV